MIIQILRNGYETIYIYKATFLLSTRVVLQRFGKKNQIERSTILKNNYLPNWRTIILIT